MINSPDELDDLTDKVLGSFCDKSNYTPDGNDIPMAWKAMRDALLVSLPDHLITYLKSDNWCFVTDNDGHWYRIPVKSREEFYEWVEQRGSYIAEEDLESCYDNFDFNDYLCMPPCNYMFKDIQVLKEGSNNEY